MNWVRVKFDSQLLRREIAWNHLYPQKMTTIVRLDIDRAKTHGIPVTGDVTSPPYQTCSDRATFGCTHVVAGSSRKVAFFNESEYLEQPENQLGQFV